MQEWILPGLSDKVECLAEDLQAEQQQGAQAQSRVVCHQLIHLPLVQKKHQKYLEVGQRSLKEDQEYLQKKHETRLERFLKQKRQLRKSDIKRVQQTSGVPIRQHYGKHENNEKQDHNTDTSFEFRHSQGNNKVQIKAQVCCAHETEEERNKQIRRSEGDDSQGVN